MEMKRKPEPIGETETILLVDDDEIILDLLQEMLHRSGYNTLAAESGERAVEVFRKHGARIDLVIMDLSMPGMGGNDCLKELLRIDPAIRVIIASGHAADRNVREHLKSGAFGFIPKPYRQREILHAIRKALDQGA